MADEIRSASRSQAEQAFLEYLLELGVIEEIRPPLPITGIREDHEPIQVEGRPISEEIIETRR